MVWGSLLCPFAIKPINVVTYLDIIALTNFFFESISLIKLTGHRSNWGKKNPTLKFMLCFCLRSTVSIVYKFFFFPNLWDTSSGTTNLFMNQIWNKKFLKLYHNNSKFNDKFEFYELIHISMKSFISFSETLLWFSGEPGLFEKFEC